MKSYTGWAIETRSEEGHGLLGRYWHFEGGLSHIPAHMEGHLTALFCTRREARAAAILVRKGVSFPKARAIKVKITIERQ